MLRLSQPDLYKSISEKRIYMTDPYEEIKKATFNYIDHHTEIKNARQIVQPIIDNIWKKITNQVNLENNFKNLSSVVFIPIYTCNSPTGIRRYVFIAEPSYSSTQVEFCKGSVDLQENIEDACLREMREEIQLNITHQQLRNGDTYSFFYENKDYHVYLFQLKQYQFEEMTKQVNNFGAISKEEQHKQYFVDINLLISIQKNHSNGFVSPFNNQDKREYLLQQVQNIRHVYTDNYIPDYVLELENQQQVYVSREQ